ncbi:protein phosphatase CheZ [Oryzomicrobium terrae]|nr:protein phosphatase CheZ [Oryzomicrobium terrae]
MSNPANFGEAGDNAELEALFDSIAASSGAPAAAAPPPAAPAPAPSAIPGTGDSDELQALFDSVAATAPAAAPVPAASTAAPVLAQESMEEAALLEVPKALIAVAGAGESWPGQDRVFNRIGQMARQLHDTLRELGYDKLLENTMSVLPDAKDRLAYVANLTEQAACRVLNATDIAKPLQDDLQSSAEALGGRWDRLYAKEMSVEEFKTLAAETRDFLKTQVPQKAAATNDQLMEIMMAQDFQDLTGQVIKKIVSLSQELESGLMKVLVEAMPEARRNDEVDSLLNGPVINPEGRSDVVGNQRQVDDLLESLGF